MSISPNRAKMLREMQDLISRVERSSENFNCFLSDCTRESISSHSISKSRVLKTLNGPNTSSLFLIEDSLSADFNSGNMSTFQARNRKLKEIPILSCSTFHGFCAPCDTAIFNRLDNDQYSNDLETNFLHALRAYANKLRKERTFYKFLKDDLSNLMKELPESFDSLSDKLSPINSILESLPNGTLISWEIAEPITVDLKQKIQDLSVYSIKTKEIELQEILARFPSDKKQYPMDIKKVKALINEMFQTILMLSGNLKNGKTSEQFKMLKEYAEGIFTHQADVERSLTKCLRNKSFNEFQTVYHSINKFYGIAGNFIYYTTDNDEMVLTIIPELETNKTHFIFSAWNPTHNQKIYMLRLNSYEPQEFKSFVSTIILSQGTNIFFSKNFLDSLEQNEKTILSQVKSLSAFFSFILFK